MKTVINHLGSVIHFFALFLILPTVVAIIYSEPVLPFFVALLAAFIIGLVLKGSSSLIRLLSERDMDITSISMAEGLALSALSYICLSGLALIPFLFVFKQRLINSLFESVAGLTTTGLTVVPDVTALPKSILFWRSELQWIGGIGIILVFLFLIYKLKYTERRREHTSSSAKSYVAIYQSILPEKLESGITTAIRRMITIYGVYTIVEVVVLFLLGLSFFEAINITFTSLSTGGFIVTRSFDYGSLQLFAISIFMLIGATSFIFHDQLFRLKIKETLKNLELRLLLILLAAATVISLTVFSDLRVVVFELLSAFTTTGYSIADIRLLPPLVILLITIGMIFGASLGSTCGGLKLFRVYSVMKAVLWRIRILSHPPTAVIQFKVRNKSVPESVLLGTEIFVSTYMMFILIGIIAFMVLGYPFLDSAFQVISAIGLVGLSTMPIYSVPLIGKLILIILMLLGRLEIFPLLVLFYKIFGKR